MKILLVDDNQSITGMFTKFFQLKGHDIFVSNSGRNGLQAIENDKFDVVLLDLAMPEFSGRDIVDRLHQNGKIVNNLIITLTASSVSDEDRDYLIRKGVHSVLKKPIDPDELLSHISRVVHN